MPTCASAPRRHVACAVDAAYAEMAGVLLLSLARHGGLGDATVHLVADGLDAATVARLRTCAGDLDLDVIDLAGRRDRIATLPVSFYSPAIHIRLLLADLIPDDGRVLYLDSDMMVMGPLGALFDADLGANLLAAVPDAGLPQVHALANARLGRPAAAPYFNSGLLVYDLETWRRLGIGERCLALAAGRDDYWPDQDAINLALDGRILALEGRWNFWSPEPLPRAAFAAARVVHFIPDKPVSPDCRHPLFADYLALRAETPWRDAPFDRTVLRRRTDGLARMAAARLRRRRQTPSL